LTILVIGLLAIVLYKGKKTIARLPSVGSTTQPAAASPRVEIDQPTMKFEEDQQQRDETA
jgi:hypothetical protein